MLIATIDAGTTNTRVVVWRGGKDVAEASRQAGVRDTAVTGSTDTLKKGVAGALAEALTAAGAAPAEDRLYIASGMITSNVGLCEIPHLVAPAGKVELAAGMRSLVLPEVADRPIWFIPGVKNHDGAIGLDDCDAMDMMRGEETEAIGVLEALGISGPAVLALPGSHAKFVKIDASGRIAASATTISGELLDALSRHTLISGSVDQAFARTLDLEPLLRGAAYGARLGVARAAFLVRLLDLFSDLDANGRANFLLGAVLSADLAALKNSRSLKIEPGNRVLAAGKTILRDALVALLKADPFFTGPIDVVPDQFRSVSALGAMEIARVRGLI